MKTRILLFCLLLEGFLPLFVSGQKENNIWVSGDKFGIDFNAAPPIFFPDSMEAYEGHASVCSPSGRLLFYCNGFTVRDSTHSLMPNGTGLLGHRSATQGVAIASVPGSDSLYYLFTVDAYETWGGFKLRYNIIDMTLNGGKGDIIPGYKNVEIDSLMSEKIQIAGSCGRNWLLTHHQSEPLFYAYDLGAASPFAGFIRPVVSRVGPTGKGYLHYEVGEMKVSRNFRKIALANVNIGYSHSDVQLYDFNQKTGLVSNYCKVDSFPSPGWLKDGPYTYSIAFSPDAKKLYCGSVQFDVSKATYADIYASRYILPFSASGRLGEDGMIYLNGSNKGYRRFKNPNMPGPLCTFEDVLFAVSGPYISGTTYSMGNRFVPIMEYNRDTTFSTLEKVMCKGWPLIISDLGYDTYRWYDGDTASRKTFTKPGKYWLQSVSSCLTNVDTFVIIEKTGDSTYALALDTAVCTGLPVKLKVPYTDGWYRWHDGDTAKTKAGTSPLTYVAISSGSECHIRFDTLKVRGIKPTYTYFRKDTLLCPMTEAVFSGRPGADAYTWYDGSKEESRLIIAAGEKYWVHSQKDCAVIVDTFNVIELPHEVFTSSRKVNICDGRSTALSPLSGHAHYKWNTGDTTRLLYVNTAGKYWVRYGEDCKLFVDTFYAYKVPYTLKKETKDTSICFQATGQIVVPAGYDSLVWSGGNTGMDTLLKESTTVRFLAADTKNCLILDKQYNVQFVDFKTNLRDTFTCNDDTLLLDAYIGRESASYYWSTGDTGARIKVNTPGSRQVFINWAACTLTDTVIVSQVPLVLSIGSDTSLCEGGKLQLRTDVNDAVYKWSTGATSQQIEVTQSGRYALHITKGVCSAATEVNVKFVPCDHCVALANAFTPNNDGINDFFKPILHCPPTSFQLKIFNRWGRVLYSSNSINDRWDGKADGMSLDGGVYFYTIRIRFEAQGEQEFLYKGDILLMR